MSRTRDLDFCKSIGSGGIGGGVTFYPYQLAFGLSLRYWKCLYAPSIRIHVGPLKVWFYVSLKLRR